MAADLETINAKAKAYASQVREALPVSKVYIFGSYVKGTATEQSDVDICFFLDTYGEKRRVDVIKELLLLTKGFDDVGFEPLVFMTSDLSKGNPFVLEVINTGIEI